VIFLGGGRAALLQLAHPMVAQAIADHSRAREDTLGRFLRTFEHVFTMVYGDLDAALSSARRVHAIHDRIRGVMRERAGAIAAGTSYAANRPETLLWVHATLWETSVQVYDLIMGPLSHAEKDAYWDETKRFATLFGIPARMVPADWSAFEDYWRGMLESDVIRVSVTARELAHHLLCPPMWWLGPPWEWLRVMTARLLPPRLRDEFDIPFGSVDQAVADVSLSALRASWWLLPGGLRWLPAYRDGARRAAGKPGRDPVSTVLEQIAKVLRSGTTAA